MIKRSPPARQLLLAQYFRFIRKANDLQRARPADAENIDKPWEVHLDEACQANFCEIPVSEMPIPEFILGRALYGHPEAYIRDSPFLLPRVDTVHKQSQYTLQALAGFLSFFCVSELIGEEHKDRPDLLGLTQSCCDPPKDLGHKDFYVYVAHADIQKHNTVYYICPSHKADSDPIDEAKKLLDRRWESQLRELQRVKESDLRHAQTRVSRIPADSLNDKVNAPTLSRQWRRETLTFALLRLMEKRCPPRKGCVYGFVVVPSVLIANHTEYRWGGIWMLVVLQTKPNGKKRVIPPRDLEQLYALTVQSNRCFDRADARWRFQRERIAAARASTYWSNIRSFSHDAKALPDLLSQLVTSDILDIELRLKLAEKLATQLELVTAAYSSIIPAPSEYATKVLIEQAEACIESESMTHFFHDEVALQFLRIITSKGAAWNDLRQTIWPQAQRKNLKCFLATEPVHNFLELFASGHSEEACQWLRRFRVIIEVSNESELTLPLYLSSGLRPRETRTTSPRLRSALRFASTEILTNWLRHAFPGVLTDSTEIRLSLSVVRCSDNVRIEWHLSPAETRSFDGSVDSGRHGLRSLVMAERALCGTFDKHRDFQGEQLPVWDTADQVQSWGLSGVPLRAFLTGEQK